MKQAEKSKLTYEKIINAAIVEYGTKSYDNASINNICNDNKISKGLVYHNFKNKDDLYLRCVELCFTDLTNFLSGVKYNSENIDENINKLMDLRYQFFQDNPYYSNIFFNTVFQPPKHLLDSIKKIRKELDDFNSSQYKKIIDSVNLREGISKDEALEHFFISVEMFNQYFSNKAYNKYDLDTLVEEHEKRLSKIINIMLYGIAKENGNHDNANS